MSESKYIGDPMSGITCEDFHSDALAPATAWEKHVRKVLYTLDIGNYQPAIKALTFPLMKAYTEKIGAEFFPITERKFPGWPIVYEKLQIFELGKGLPRIIDFTGGGTGRFEVREEAPDWNIFFDADALISPEMFDVTLNISPDTVLFNGKDMSQIRFRPDHYFRRDGRYIGACNWFACASSLCLDLWRPLEDLTLEQAVSNITVTNQEHNSGMFQDNHLIDDYTLSRNISRFSLKHDTLLDVCGRMGMRNQFGAPFNPFLWHKYSCTEKQKIDDMLQVLAAPPGQIIGEPGMGRPSHGFGLMSPKDVNDFRSRLFQDERGQWDLRG
jgi:hypothetical protein